MPVSTKPNVGKQPIEIFNRGTDVHLGSPITKIKKEVDKNQGGSVVERNPYANYQSKAI